MSYSCADSAVVQIRFIIINFLNLDVSLRIPKLKDTKPPNRPTITPLGLLTTKI